MSGRTRSRPAGHGRPSPLLRVFGGLAALCLLATACDDGPTGPAPDRFALSFRNLIVERDGATSFEAEFTLFADEGVDPEAITGIDVVWPADLHTSSVDDPVFDPAPSRGAFTTFADASANAPLLPGSYTVLVHLDGAGPVEVDARLTTEPMEGPHDPVLTVSATSVHLDWTSPFTEHEASFELWTLPDPSDPTSGTLAASRPTLTTAGNGHQARLGFGDAIAPGEGFRVRLVMENDQNLRTWEVTGTRPDG